MAIERYKRDMVVVGRRRELAMQQPVRTPAVSPAELATIANAYVGKRPERWQDEAFNYYNAIPEIAFIVDITAKAVAECLLVPEEWDEENGVWVETQDDRVQRVMNAFIGPNGEQAELMHDAAKNLQITGDCYLLGDPLEDQPQAYLWEFLSTSEIRVEAQPGREATYKRQKTAGGQPASIDPNAYIARLYRRHPQFSKDSDSSIRHVLDLCRLLAVYDALLEAVSKSRLHAGILYVPDELSFGPIDDTEAQDGESEDIDPLIKEILEYVLDPIQDNTSPSAVAPLIMRGPAEFENAVQLKPFERQLDQQYIGIRKELRDRLSIGLDAPPEVIDGKASLNQWSGYQIDSQFLGKHIIPVGKRIARFVATSYLRPMLQTFEDMDATEANQFRIKFDASEIKVRADEVATARRAYQDHLINAEAARRHMGFTEADAPDLTEMSPTEKIQFYMNLIAVAPVSLGPVMLPLLGKAIGDPDLEAVEFPEEGAARPSEEPEGPSDTEVENGGEPGRPVENRGKEPGGSGEPRDSRPGNRPNAPEASNVITALTVTADSTWERAMERAASRYISKAKAGDQFTGLPKTHIFSRLAPSDLSAIGETPESLFNGDFESFGQKVKPWIKGWLTDEFEVDGINGDDEAAVIAQSMADNLQDFTFATLHTEPTLREGRLRVPSAVVTEALSATGRIVWDAV